MIQTNIELFTTRASGRYKGMLEGIAQWFENLEGYYNMETYNFDDKYTTKRVAQLQDMDKQDLINLMAKYELELLDYADRLLSEEPISMDAGTGCGTVQLLGQSVTELVSQLDKDKEYKGIYSI